MRRRRALEPPFATPPIALDQEAEQSKSDPWSERLPDGRTVNEAIMGTLQREQSQTRSQPEVSRTSPRDVLVTDSRKRLTSYPGLDVRPDEMPMQAKRRVDLENGMIGDSDPPIYGSAMFAPLNRPDTALDYGYELPTRAAGATDQGQASTGSETRPWKAGYGVKETDPLKREAARIRAMIENPASQVSPDGSVGVPHPMGRVKGTLLGALFGLAQGDRNTSLAERLAGGAAGAGVGAFKPRAVQDWRRRMEVEDAQGQLAQQTKLGVGQAQLENLRAETQSRMADLTMDPETGQIVKRQPRRAPQYIERSDGVYEVSEAHPQGRRIGNIPAEVKTRSRGAVHYENREDGVYAIYEDESGIKSQKVEGVPGKPSEQGRKEEEGRTKREAKFKEAQGYNEQADAIDRQADGLTEHIRKVEEGMNTIPQYVTSMSAVDAEGNPAQVPNPARENHLKALNDLKKQQQDLRNDAIRLRGEGRKAQAAGESIPDRPAQASQSGRKWSASRWAKANPSGDVEAAKAAARAAGYQVVE